MKFFFDFRFLTFLAFLFFLESSSFFCVVYGKVQLAD